MNIEAYNLDSLRKLVRSLQDENKRLKEQLGKANIPYNEENAFVNALKLICEINGIRPLVLDRWQRNWLICADERFIKRTGPILTRAEGRISLNK